MDFLGGHVIDSETHQDASDVQSYIKSNWKIFRGNLFLDWMLERNKRYVEMKPDEILLSVALMCKLFRTDWNVYWLVNYTM